MLNCVNLFTKYQYFYVKNIQNIRKVYSFSFTFFFFVIFGYFAYFKFSKKYCKFRWILSYFGRNENIFFFAEIVQNEGKLKKCYWLIFTDVIIELCRISGNIRYQIQWELAEENIYEYLMISSSACYTRCYPNSLWIPHYLLNHFL